MAEDNSDELMSPVTSVKSDSAGSKPDKTSSGKPRSLSNGRRVLPCYGNSSNSSYSGGNTRRQSIGKLGSPDSGQDVLPHYLRASTGSCHDFCKYGKKHLFEEKPWHPLPKRKDKLPADEQSPTRTMVGETKKGTVVKQKPSTTAGIMLEEKTNATVVHKKPSSFSGSMHGEARKETMVKKKPSTISVIAPGEAKNETVVKQKPSVASVIAPGKTEKGIIVKEGFSRPPGSMLEKGKNVDIVNQKPSARRNSILGGRNKVAVVEQKPSSPPGSMLEERDDITVVTQKPSSPPGSKPKEGDDVAVVNQESFSPLGNMLGKGDEVSLVNHKSSPISLGSVVGEDKKVNVVEQKTSDLAEMLADGEQVSVLEETPSVLGEGKKVALVNQKTSPNLDSLEPSEIIKGKAPQPSKSVDSLKLDSSIDKIPNIEKKMKNVSAMHSPFGLKRMKSSSKTLGGADAGSRKDNYVNLKRSIIVSRVSLEKSLKTPSVARSPKSSSIMPLILRARNNRSLKLLAPLKDQDKMQRKGTNSLNPDMVPKRTLRVIKVKASPKYSAQSESRLLSNEEDTKEFVESSDKRTSSSKKLLLHKAEAESVGKVQKKMLKKGKASVSDEYNPSAVKLKFRRGKVVDLQQETSSPRRLTFRLGRRMGESVDNKCDVRKRILKKKGVDGDKSSTSPVSGKIVLRHQDVQEKKDAQVLLNNVIEETASKLVESKKSKVKALVGAFETVISLQDKPSTVTVT